MKSYCSLQIWVPSYVLNPLTEEVLSHQANMTNAAVSYSFCFVFTRDLYNTRYITYFMAPLFYAFLVPLIVVGVLLTCQSLDPEYKTTAFFSDVFPRKNIVIWRFSTAWYGTVRHGSVRYGTAQFGSVAFPPQFSTAIEWAGLFTRRYNCAASTAVTSS